MNQLSGLTSGARSPFMSLLKSGKSRDLARMVNSISSVLNNQAKFSYGQDSLELVKQRKKV